MKTHTQLVVGMIVSLSPLSSAISDDRAKITEFEQELSNAIATGDVAVWNQYLDASVIFAEEDDSYKGKADMLKEIRPLPKGISGAISVELLSFHQDGAVAVALFRQDETEQYFGQVLHARYLTNTTWRKRTEGWKLIAAQVLAEKSDPPAIKLTPNVLNQYVGTYRLKNAAAIYSLKVVDGQLHSMRDARDPVIWNAEVADVFFVKSDPRIRKIFQRDISGKITGFVERRETWDIVWVKVAD